MIIEFNNLFIDYNLCNSISKCKKYIVMQNDLNYSDYEEKYGECLSI